MTGHSVPWLLPGTTLVAVDAQTVVREADGHQSTVRNALLAHLVQALGGTLAGPVPLAVDDDLRTATAPALDYLARRDCLVCLPADTAPEVVATALRGGAPAAELGDAVRRLRECTVAVTVLDPAFPAVPDLLRAAGVNMPEDTGADPPGAAEGGLALVICDDLTDPAAVERVDQWLRAGREVVAGSARRGYLSPVLRAGGPLCATCLRQLVHANRPATAHIERTLRVRLPGALGSTSADQLTFAAATARLITRQVVSPGWRARYATHATVLSADGTPTVVPVFSRPDCPRCATPAQSAISSVDPTFGLIRSIRVRTLGAGLRVARAEHALLTGPVAAPEAAAVLHAYRSFSEGKGDSDRRAVQNAAGEVVERLSGVFHRRVPVRWGRLDELPGPALTPPELTLFSVAQYADRAAHNQRHSGHNHVPRPYDPAVRMPWTPARPLGAGEPVLVPCAYAYTEADHLLDVPLTERFVRADSNGCAGAGTVDEACLYGLLELVERDAVAIWWHNRLRMPPVPPADRDRPMIERVARVLADRDRDLHLLDLTHDLGVPVCAAVAPLRRPGVTGSSEMVVGFGAGLTGAVAAERACLEALQFLPMLDDLPADERRFGRHGRDSQAWWSSRVERQPWLVPDGTVPPAPRRELRVLDDLVGAIEAAGLRAYWIDQSQPRFELSVVRVIVPGLRHFWRRLAPGRLYDVPIAGGRLATPLAEEELNPLSVFF